MSVASRRSVEYSEEVTAFVEGNATLQCTLSIQRKKERHSIKHLERGPPD